MLATLISIIVGIAVIIFAIAILGARDAIRQRRMEARRPIPDRIADIQAMANYTAGEIERRVPPDRADWRGPVIDFYHRLEELCSSPKTTPEEAEKLASEAATYIRDHRLKGFSVDLEARRLARLIRERNAG